jgi:hypothetical protein
MVARQCTGKGFRGYKTIAEPGQLNHSIPERTRIHDHGHSRLPGLAGGKQSGFHAKAVGVEHAGLPEHRQVDFIGLDFLPGRSLPKNGPPSQNRFRSDEGKLRGSALPDHKACRIDPFFTQ